MLFSKNNNSRSSRMRSMGKRVSKKRNMMGGGGGGRLHLTLHVIHPDGKVNYTMIAVYPDDTIARVKYMIKNTIFRASYEVDLVFNDRVLDDDRTVAYYNIHKDSELQLIEKRPGIIAEWLSDQVRKAAHDGDERRARDRYIKS